MHETGALKAVFPEQEQIDCLVIRDFHHRYTVDEHTLTTIRILAGLQKSDDPGVKPYAELLSELENRAALYFALLYHDVGKGTPDEGHVDASLRICQGAMQRIGMPEAERETVRFLIGKHLALSATMHERDLEDPLAIELLAHRMETVERLKALTLLTYADISAVNPGTMTPWRRSQLWRLYTLTYNELTRALNAERIEPRSADSPEKASFLEGFPTRYLRTHTEKEIDEHLKMEKKAAARAGVAIDLKKLEGAYLLTVVTADRPFLFASIAGTLSSFGMNILKAEAFANRRGTVLDTFTFADPHRTLELNPQEIDRLTDTLERVVLGKIDVTKLLRNRPPATLPSKGARFEPSLAFDSESSATATLIQIVAEDRPGLLYDLASAISREGCNIEVVLIDTEAHKAIDVFYVTEAGSKLDIAHQERLRESLLQAL
jgi:[protein-PII] uridylyltransferase